MSEREIQQQYDRQEEPEPSCEDGEHRGPWRSVGSYRDTMGCDVEFVKCMVCGETMS